MTEKKYSGLGSRIVLGTLRPANSSDDEDIFLSDSVADRPELRVQLRYFTVELKPSRSSARSSRGKYDSTSVEVGNISLGNGQKKAKLEESISSTETISSESFHSCRSTPSVQELSVDVDRKPASGTKRAVIRDDELLNHLTMVNAIFLSKSVSDSTHHEDSEKNLQQSVNNSCKTDSFSVSRMPSSSNKVCSEAYTCQINHNPRVKYISKIHGNNIVAKPVVNSFDNIFGKIDGDRLSYTKTFSGSFDPVLSPKKNGFEIVESFNTYDRNDLFKKLSETSSSNCVFPNNVCSKYSTYKRLEIEVPEMKFAEIMPLCDESYLPVVLEQQNTEKDWRRRRSLPGCEERLEFSSPNNSLSLISNESKDDILDSTDVLQGDGDYSGYAYTENTGRRGNKRFLKNIDDTYLRMLISKSLKKIQNESESNLRAPDSDESDIFQSDEETYYKENDLKENVAASEQIPLQVKKLRLDSCFKESNRDRYGTDGSVNLEEDHSLPSVDEYEQSSELVASEVVPDHPEHGCCKRGVGGRRTLPVIQEESSEESEELREDDLADDYCLIDSSGRPIHLFDNRGLPLTDNSGRPLRSAQGKLLMDCDENGIPVVELGCALFDMFGRQPHEDRFDPSMAPKMAGCSKLSAGDGRPLLLFDAQGRPLTSVSGTMLVDSSGRGLVRLSTAPEPPP